MGFIRGSVFVVLGVLLFIFLLVGNTLLTFSMSLEYETVKPELISVVNDFVNNDMGIDIQGELDKNLVLVEEYCSPSDGFSLNIGGEDFNLKCDIINQGEGAVVNYVENSNGLEQEVIQGTISANYDLMKGYCKEDKEFVFSEGNYTFDIPCSVALQGSDAILEHATEDLIKQMYYKNYSCEFIDCFKEISPPTFMISEKTRDYFNSNFYMVLGICVLLSALMLVVSTNRQGWFFVVGTLIIVASLPFMKLRALIGLIPENVFTKFLGLFFIDSYDVFIIGLITGIIFIVLGFVVKFFFLGFKFNRFVEWLKKRKNVAKKKVVSKNKSGEVVVDKGE